MPLTRTGQHDRLSHRFFYTRRIGFAGSRNIKGCSVVNTRTDNRQADCNVHTGFKAKHLNRAVSLVMIHSHHYIKVASHCSEEKRVSGQRTECLYTFTLCAFNGKDNFLFLFSMSISPA
jgi:hypothetical protein